MRNLMLVLLIALPMLGTGCTSFGRNGRRNMIATPMQSYTERAQHHRDEALGREAFRQMALQYPDHEFSCDYRKGFVEGFADYLDYGGTGEPPPIPTHDYRTFSYMTPEGLAAMEDWKLGWRHGSATAKVSNLRELNTLPVHWGPVYANSTPIEANPPHVKKSEEPTLPAPRKADGAPDAKADNNPAKGEAPNQTPKQ